MEEHWVRVESISTVTPSSIQDHGSWVLSPFDQNTWCLGYRTWFLFYKPDEGEFEVMVSKLKKSLSRVLVSFYPFAGRLHVTSNQKLECKCNGAGAKFTTASSALTLQELLDVCKRPWPPNMLQDLACSRSSLRRWGDEVPLLFIQITRFQCGGLAIAVTSNHQISDGTTAMELVKAWAHASQEKPVTPPNIMQEVYVLPSPESCPTQKLPPDHICISKNPVHSSNEVDGELVTMSFEFSKAKLDRLKHKESIKDSSFSTFQTLSSNIWCSINAARLLQPEESTRLLFPANCRERLPYLPFNYFGNALVMIVAKSIVKQLDAFHGAELLQESIRIGTTKDKIEEMAYFYDKYSDSKYVIWPDNTCGQKNYVVIGGSMRFDFYSVDFGFTGTPIFSSCLRPKDGWGYYHGGKEFGSVHFVVSLPKDVMERLLHDPLFYED